MRLVEAAAQARHRDRIAHECFDAAFAGSRSTIRRYVERARWRLAVARARR